MFQDISGDLLAMGKEAFDGFQKSAKGQQYLEKFKNYLPTSEHRQFNLTDFFKDYGFELYELFQEAKSDYQYPWRLVTMAFALPVAFLVSWDLCGNFGIPFCVIWHTHLWPLVALLWLNYMFHYYPLGCMFITHSMRKISYKKNVIGGSTLVCRNVVVLTLLVVLFHFTPLLLLANVLWYFWLLQHEVSIEEDLKILSVSDIWDTEARMYSPKLDQAITKQYDKRIDQFHSSRHLFQLISVCSYLLGQLQFDYFGMLYLSAVCGTLSLISLHRVWNPNWYYLSAQPTLSLPHFWGLWIMYMIFASLKSSYSYFSLLTLLLFGLYMTLVRMIWARRLSIQHMRPIPSKTHGDLFSRFFQVSDLSDEVKQWALQQLISVSEMVQKCPVAKCSLVSEYILYTLLYALVMYFQLSAVYYITLFFAYQYYQLK